jgi:hypothetical protein
MPLNARTVADIIVRFTTDKASKDQAKSDIQDVQTSAQTSAGGTAGTTTGVGGPTSAKEALESTTDALARQQEIAMVLKNTMTTLGVSEERAAEVLTENYGMTKEEILSTAHTLDTSTKQADQATQGFLTTNTQIWKTRMAGFTAMVTGLRLEAFGKQLISPIQSFVNYAGVADSVSKEWLQTQTEISDAVNRIGKDMAEGALPALREAARLMGQIADFADKHPGVASAVAGIGTGAIAIGALLQSLGSIMIGLVAIKGLAGVFGTGGALTGILSGLVNLLKGIGGGALGFLGGTAGAATLGVGAGVLGYNAIAGATGRPSAGTILGQGATLAAYGAGRYGVGGSPERAAEWASAIGQLTGVLDKMSTSAQGAAQNLSIGADALKMVSSTSQQARKAYDSMVQEDAKAAEAMAQKHAEIDRKYAQDLAKLEQDYANTRAKTLSDYYNSEKDAETNYYSQRTKAAQDYNDEIQKMEEDHQLEMKKLEEEHNERMLDLVDARDALGIVREMRSYERQRQDAENQYQLELAQKNRDFARSMADLAKNFAQERAQRLAQLQAQLIDEAQNYDTQTKQLAEQHQQDLTDLQNQYNEERSQRHQAYAQQLKDLAASLQEEFNLKATFTQAEINYIRAAIAQLQGGAIPAMASGGYTPGGLTLLHPEEYVLTKQTTRSLEQAAGGRLSQSKVLAMLGGGSGFIYNDQRQYNRSLTAEDREDIRAMTRQDLREAFSNG